MFIAAVLFFTCLGLVTATAEDTPVKWEVVRIANHIGFNYPTEHHFKDLQKRCAATWERIDVRPCNERVAKLRANWTKFRITYEQAAKGIRDPLFKNEYYISWLEGLAESEAKIRKDFPPYPRLW